MPTPVLPNQVDVSPSTVPTGLAIHVPVGASQSGTNDPSSFPAPSKKTPQVTVAIRSSNGYAVKFSNPS